MNKVVSNQWSVVGAKLPNADHRLPVTIFINFIFSFLNY